MLDDHCQLMSKDEVIQPHVQESDHATLRESVDFKLVPTRNRECRSDV